jgi:raffinose/stachyose/melibiose transport system substrate-binding protein
MMYKPQGSISRRRFLQHALGAGSAVLILSACAAPAPITDEQPAASGAGSSETVELTMWGNHPEWKDRVLAILQAFETDTPQIKVLFDPKPGDAYQTALNTALAAGEAPDLIGLFPGPALADAAQAQQILQLTEKVDITRLTPTAQEASKSGDQVYAIPIVGAYTVGLFYQKAIFAKHQLTPPTTWDELRTIAQTLKEQGETPMIMPAKDGIIPYFFYMHAACSVFGPAGYAKLRKGEIKLTDEDVAPAMALTRQMADFFQEGYLSTSYVEGKALFARERGAMIIGGSADYSGYREVNPQVDVSVVAFPAPTSNGFPSTTSGMELVYGVNSKSKAPEAGVTLLNWFMGDKAGQMVADNITLSTVKGIVPSNNPVLAEMVQAATNDVRVWYEVAATAKVFDLFTSQSQKLYTDEVTPAEFAQMAQDAIVPET